MSSCTSKLVFSSAGTISISDADAGQVVAERRVGASEAAAQLGAVHRAVQQEAGDGGKTASPDANEMDVCHMVLRFTVPSFRCTPQAQIQMQR